MMSDIKSQAKSSRNSKLHTLGGKGTIGKQLPMGAGSTWNGAAGVDSGQLADEQKIRTRKDGGRVGGSAVKPRLDRVARASGGKVGGKGKTNITIVMAPGGQGNGSQAPQAVPVPRPIPVPIQAPPPGAGPPMGMGAPSMAPPSAAPPAPPPGMGRKRGGRVGKSGGGESGPGSMVSDIDDENLKVSKARRQQSEGTSPDDDSIDRTITGMTKYPDGGSAPTPKQMTSTPRKRAGGGKITAGKGLGMTAGSRSGSGRLQKIAIQKKTYP